MMQDHPVVKFDRINIEIINTCNLKCSFCPAPQKQTAQMSPAQFSQVAAAIKPLTREVVLHLLGEPLSHPEFAEVIEAAAQVELPVNIVTNGVLLTGERVKSVLNPIVRQVSVSLQSFADNFHRQDPTPYIRRIKGFCDRALRDRPDLFINLRFWDLDGTQASETDHNHIIRTILAREFNFNWGNIDIDVRRRKNHRLQGRLYLHFDSRFSWPDMANPIVQTQGHCHALTGHIGIHADGTVVPCCLDHKAEINLGNIFASDISSILESPRAKAMREGFSAGVLQEELCKRCGFITRFGRAKRKREHSLKQD